MHGYIITGDWLQVHGYVITGDSGARLSNYRGLVTGAWLQVHGYMLDIHKDKSEIVFVYT